MFNTSHTARIALLTTLIAVGAVSAQARENGPERATFQELDLNGNGELTLQELQDARTTMMTARFDAADSNNDGELSAEEMLAASETRREERQQKRISRMIERADTDGNGSLSAAEMAAHRGDRGGERRGRSPERMFDRIDANDDGAIDADEYAMAMERFAERRGEHGGRKGGGHKND